MPLFKPLVHNASGIFVKYQYVRSLAWVTLALIACSLLVVGHGVKRTGQYRAEGSSGIRNLNSMSVLPSSNPIAATDSVSGDQSYKIVGSAALQDPGRFLVRHYPGLLDDRQRDNENACIYILARNSDANALAQTLTQLEKTWNERYNYPYIIINDEVFSIGFMNSVRRVAPFSNFTFGLVPSEHWSYPSWINITKADEARAKMAGADVLYGGSLSYRHMCRYNSGFFFRHPLLATFDFYWRVEPGANFMCTLNFDPFRTMQSLGKRYAFTIVLEEIEGTVASLWNATLAYALKRQTLGHLPHFMKSDFAWNLCHYWSNFEIADLSFFRSQEYLDYFTYLDRLGGFYYERWGDAPVHTLATAMLLRHNQVHFFDEIGYYHAPFSHMPLQDKGNCTLMHLSTSIIEKRDPWCLRHWLLSEYHL